LTEKMGVKRGKIDMDMNRIYNRIGE